METQSRQLIESSQRSAIDSAFDTHPQNSRALRVLIDARKLGDGGIGVYIDNTIRGLLELRSVELTLIAARSQFEEALSQQHEWRDEVKWICNSSKPYSLSEYFVLPRKIDFKKFDLYHAPHYTLPFGISIPTVVTIHDLIHIEHPEAFYYPLIAKRLISSSAKRASKIIAVSEDTKRSILAHTTVDAAKIACIPNAIPNFLKKANTESSVFDSEIDLLSGGKRYFIAVVSNSKPHKGINDLLEAYSASRSASGEGSLYPELFLVGYGSEKYRDSLRVQSIPGIKALGSVQSDLLRALYARADALIVPSLAEGFCFPVLEAQSVGTRVVCRPVAAIKEILSGSDLVAKDLSVAALSDAIFRAYAESANDSTERSGAALDLKRASLVHYTNDLERFALKTISRQLLDLYTGVLQEHRKG